MLIILEDWLDFLAMLACWLHLLRWIVSSYGWLAGYASRIAMLVYWLSMLPGGQCCLVICVSLLAMLNA
jgi:hypothetical protein